MVIGGVVTLGIFAAAMIFILIGGSLGCNFTETVQSNEDGVVTEEVKGIKLFFQKRMMTAFFVSMSSFIVFFTVWCHLNSI